MNDQPGGPDERPEWREERFRYRVLRLVYEHAAGSPALIVSGVKLEEELRPGDDELSRAITFLEHEGYLITGGERERRLCITGGGIDYIERLAGRRRSIRAPEPEYARSA
jgi:hypothetical protein